MELRGEHAPRAAKKMAQEHLGPSFALLGEAAHELRNLQRDPDAAFVIAAAFMIVAKVAVSAIPALMEIPVVGMIAEGHAGDVNPAIGVPAITFVVARNVGVGDNGRRCQTSDSQECCRGTDQNEFFQNHLGLHRWLSSRKERGNSAPGAPKNIQHGTFSPSPMANDVLFVMGTCACAS